MMMLMLQPVSIAARDIHPDAVPSDRVASESLLYAQVCAGMCTAAFAYSECCRLGLPGSPRPPSIVSLKLASTARFALASHCRLRSSFKLCFRQDRESCRPSCSVAGKVLRAFECTTALAHSMQSFLAFQFTCFNALITRLNALGYFELE